MSRFNECLAFTWRPENDGQPLHLTAGDRGGATAWGVTLSTYASWCADNGLPTPTAATLAAASKSDLGELYRARYWNTVQGDHLPVGVDLLVYDFGVTSGPGRSARLLQEVLGGLRVDGGLGPATLAAVARADRLDLVRRLGARHAAYYEGLADFPRFGRGWLRRSSDRLTAALAAPIAAPSPAPVSAPVAPHPGVFAATLQEVRHALGS